MAGQRSSDGRGGSPPPPSARPDGLTRVTRRYTKDEVLGLMDPVIQEWFRSRFDQITDPQACAIPLIHRGENVLVSSPTGTGKTITAFLSIINELFSLHKTGKLEDKIYCVYISPLKALANDISKNLQEPLAQITQLAIAKGLQPPGIRVGVRSGDTSAAERQRMAKRPPHIFVTTPESVALVLSAPKFREKFRDVRYLIVDEIHEISSTKRGVFLSLSVERLQENALQGFTRIGLSATQAPIEEIAHFLGGLNGGAYRPVHIVESKAVKQLDLGILSPVADMTVLPYEVVNDRMYETLEALIAKHKTTLVFTNTRSGTESVVFRLKEHGLERVAAHHGSLSKETRLQVEEQLRAGQLSTVVTSTSLELGIDIGHIDLVCQIASPKSVAKGLQRVGRAGHGVYDTSKGRFIVSEPDDLLECAVLVRSAYDGRIDRIRILHNALDVLAQSLVGMSLERRWTVDEGLALVRRSHCFQDLPRDRLIAVLEYLAGRAAGTTGGYGRIWYDSDAGIFEARKGTRMIYFLNIGTIAEEASYKVLSSQGNLGKLSEKFVEKLGKGDVFVLGGRTYEFDRARGMAVYVRDAQGRRPTVPSWSGEMLPRSYDLSISVGKFRGEVTRRLKAAVREAAGPDGKGALGESLAAGVVEKWLQDDFHVDSGAAKTIVNYIREQRNVGKHVPTDTAVLIEGYIDGQGNPNIIFHYPFGRRTNDALARAYAHAISGKLGGNIRVSLTDDTFMLTLPKKFPLKSVQKLLNPENLEENLRSALRQTELFKQRFRHCAMRAFAVLRNFRGREIPVSRQVRHTSRLLASLEDESFPIIQETFNEILHEAMDLDAAREVVGAIDAGRIELVLREYTDVPTPFAHNVILVGAQDIVMMRDRSALLRELHKKVLTRLVAEVPGLKVDPLRIDAHYRGKIPSVQSKEDLLYVLRLVGPLDLFRESAADGLAAHTSLPFETIRGWATELLNGGQICSIYRRGALWIPREMLPLYRSLWRKDAPADPQDKAVLAKLASYGRVKDKKEVKERLRALEKALVIHRVGVEPDGKVRYAQVTDGPAPYEDALRTLVRRHVEFHSPSTLEEIAFAVGVSDSTVQEILRTMDDVYSGEILPGSTQHILVRDRIALEGQEKRPVFEESEVTALVLRKHFHEIADSDVYFDRFSEAAMSYDVYNHAAQFDMEEWYQLRERGAVIEGRFLRANVVYIRKEDMALFATLAEREPVSAFEQKILGLLTPETPLPLAEILRRLEGSPGKEPDRLLVKEAVEKLDRCLYVYRPFSDRREWAARNFYAPLPPTQPVPEADRILLERALRGHGPATLNLLRNATGLTYERLNQLLADLERDGKAVRILVLVDGVPQESFATPDDLQSLGPGGKTVQVRDPVRVLSLFDPYILRRWNEVVQRFGESWVYPVVQNGALAGFIEKWLMSGCVEIREVDVPAAILVDLLGALDRMMGYYRGQGIDVLRIRRVRGTEIKDLDAATRALFAAAGYVPVQDFLVKGPVIPTTYPRRTITTHLLWRQRIHPERKVRDTLEAVSALGGLHTDFEADARVKVFTPFRKHRDRLATGLAIPEYLTICTHDDICLYQSAKGRPRDGGMEDVLRALHDGGGLTRKQLFERCNLDNKTFSASLRRAYSALLVVRDMNARYVAVQTAGLPLPATPEARRKVLGRIIESFGIVSAEQLAAYTKHEFRMREIRDALAAWERDGTLQKGYLVEGDDTLYWILAADVPLLGRKEFTARLVLPPTDPFCQFLAEEIRHKFQMGACFVILNGPELAGAFKATRKAGVLHFTSFQGDERAMETLREFGRRWGMKVTATEGAGEVVDHGQREEDEWETMLYWEKTRSPQQ